MLERPKAMLRLTLKKVTSQHFYLYNWVNKIENSITELKI